MPGFLSGDTTEDSPSGSNVRYFLLPTSFPMGDLNEASPLTSLQ